MNIVGNTSQYNPATNELAILIGRRPVEAGLRVFNENVETFQFTAGFKGYFNLGGNEWDWDLNDTYADDYQSNITTGLFNTARLAQALDSPGFAPCASVAGCVPFNIFGGAGSITPQMLNYVQFEEHDLSEVQMRNYTGNINGSIVDLPAGPLAAAAGYEYLELNGFFHPDSTVSSGNTTGNVTQPTDGRTRTNAEYIELDIPLVADAPGFKMLDLDVANRWSKFEWKGGIPGSIGPNGSFVSHFASASTGRAALKWQPSDSLLVRAAWSQGFRAPSVSELFLGNSDSFPAATDPCAPKPGGWDGVPADLPKGCGGKSRTQPNGQIKSTIGGNANLHPERALSRSIGFVYNPDFIPGFDFSLDYYKIELNQEITAIPVQTILNGCYVNSNSSDCKLITVSGGKFISDILDTNTNIGGIKTDGVDLSTHYKLPSTSVGDFKIGLDWTFLKSYLQTIPNAGTPSGFSSTELGGNTTAFGGFPKQKANASLNWNYGDWSGTWAAQYIGSMYEACTSATLPTNVGGRNECSDPGNLSPSGKTYKHAKNYLGKTIYHDVTATYHFDSLNTDFSFGIRNLFDKQPPTALTAFANSFLPSFYRVPGREFYGRISVKF